MSACSTCGAPVTWGIVAASGKRMPIDPEPAHGGNIVIDEYDAQGVPRLRVLKKDDRGQGGALYKSHFATCPQAARHRR